MPLPFAPTTATRSPHCTSRSSGPRTNAPRSTTRAARAGRRRRRCARRREPELELPRLVRLVDGVEPAELLLRTPSSRPSTSSSCGPARSRAPPIAACGAPAPRCGPSRRRSPPTARSGARAAARAPPRTRSSRPRTRVAPCVHSSSSTTFVTVRSRNARSCETTTTAPSNSRENASSRASPAKSRSFVGSSSSSTSKRLSRIDASAARAASPPESPASARSSATPSPSSASTAAARASRSPPPRARNASSASLYSRGELRLVAEPRGEAVHPLRRRGDAGAAREIREQRLAVERVALLRQVADGERRRVAPDGSASGSSSPASSRSSVDLPAPFGPTSPIRARGGTTRSTPARTTWAPCDFVTPDAARVPTGRIHTS